MKEWADILAEAARVHAAETAYALATVVKVEGSAYRQPGARMLIGPDGATTGTISGGCLEDEVVEQALQSLQTQRPIVRPFHLGEDDHLMGFGTGCDGEVLMLIEPIMPVQNPNPLTLLQTAWASRQTAWYATVIGPIGTPWLGQRWMQSHADAPTDTLTDPDLRTTIAHVARTAPTENRPFIRPLAGVEVLFERIRPPIHLYLFGEGPDVQPIIEMAQGLGWRVTVVGRKSPAEMAERFPAANQHIFLMHPAQVAEKLMFDAWSAAVVMTHHYLRDQALLPPLLASPVRSVGMLGPKHRSARMLEELEAQDIYFSEDQRNRLYTPIGLDIGTENPHEIALSIVAEIQAIFHERTGGFLRHRTAPIH